VRSMNSQKLVIFDCDGTLVDSQNSIAEAMTQAFRENDLEPPSRAVALSTIGLSPIEAMRQLEPGITAKAHESLAASYKSVYRRFFADPQHVDPLFDGARETLLWLSSNPEVVLGIATGNSRRGVRRILDQHQLQGCFSTVQTADDAPSKPHPAMIYQAMTETGAQAEDTLMIGDTTYDMDLAHNAGIHAVGVGWGYHSATQVNSRKPRYFSNNFNELNAVFDVFCQGIKRPVHGG
jgi:phosphoglycolate phosphatase